MVAAPDRQHGLPRQTRIAHTVFLASIALIAAFEALPLRGQPTVQGIAFLRASQKIDGSWESASVRRSHATAEALLTLQQLSPGDLGPRAAAANYLAAISFADNEELGLRLRALAGEGRDVAALTAQLIGNADLRGGWGLSPAYVNDPLDTATVLQALEGRLEGHVDLLRAGLLRLLVTQRADGGFPCFSTAATEPESEIYCSAHALLALLPSRSRFQLDNEVNAVAQFLAAQRNADGSYGPAGPERLLRSALAAMALASVPAFGNEVTQVTAYLLGQQQADGSWQGDAFTTALVLRALARLASVPFCGDGLVNQPAETCDGAVPPTYTCEGLGLGPGALACSSQCTLDTSGCSAAPVCGDNLRNQPFETCDGSDLAAQTCTLLGFAAGNLACAANCLTFDVSGCTSAPACGDGIINQTNEACDLSDLGGVSCESLGLGGGLLSCRNDCGFDTSQCDSAGFEIDNKGREFFVGFLVNHQGTATASVNLTSDRPTTVTVQYPVISPSFSTNVNLTPGQITVVNLPSATHTGWGTGVIRNNAVRVAAPEDVVVYLVNRTPFTSDAAMALPVDALGTSYLVSTYRGSQANNADRSEFLVIAPFDDTSVTITPKATLRLASGSTPANVPFSLTLSRGQGFRGEALASGADLTGSAIEANRPIAVLNGNTCTNVPTNVTACDHVFEFAHPVQSWGTSALVANLPNRLGGSVYRVLASVNGTQVKLDGVAQATLARGQFFEIGPLAGDHHFTADQPIFVTQFMTGVSSPGATSGDPAMANMIPPDQYLESYTFSTVGGAQFTRHFLTLITPATAIGSVLLDGSPIAGSSFTPIGGTGYSAARLQLSEGSHTTSSPQPHGITVEGYNQADSYLYPGGSRLAFINQFCGDGAANREAEECDTTDFRGNNCSSFGFSSGFLLCTANCRIDVTNCSGIGDDDGDDDGFPAVDDCDDADPEVNPGMSEIPGNGKDDDCNPGTPDTIPPAAVSCRLLLSQQTYLATDFVAALGELTNANSELSLSGLQMTLAVEDPLAALVFSEERLLATLPPGARAQQSFTFPVVGLAAGNYSARLTILSGANALTTCTASFTIDASIATGAGLVGNLELEPGTVNAGDSSVASYTVTNAGNTEFVGLEIRVVLTHPDIGGEVGELTETINLAPGETYTASQLLSTVGLLPKGYLAVLIAKLPDSGVEVTLDSEPLIVVNVAPDCDAATATSNALWPPNHQLVKIGIAGVQDADGDPITLTITEIRQDEPTNDTGDGSTCPDASGIGTAEASVRSERMGKGDGRVYHLSFTAADGRGGQCQGMVKVCVPKSQGGAHATCVDQGPLHDATTCP